MLNSTHSITRRPTQKGGANLNRDERLQLCVSIAERQLLVAMLQIRHGEGFRSILHKEFDRLKNSPNIQEAYALTCYFQSLAVPLLDQVLWRMTGFNSPIEMSLFIKGTDELILRKGNKLYARHKNIAPVISTHAYTSPVATQRALKIMLTTLDLDEQQERDIFINLMYRYKLVLNGCGHERALIDDLYGGIIKNGSCASLYMKKFVHVAYGMPLKVLGEIDSARHEFKNALACDAQYGFAHRQLAWLEHSQGNLSEAARLAEKAANFEPDSMQSQFQCAQILELNTFDNFKRAGQYFDRALALNPGDEKVLEAKENYDAIVDNVIPAIRELQGEQLLPYYIMKDLRPSLKSLKGMTGINHKDVEKKLWGYLFNMQEEATEDERNVLNAIADINYKSNKGLKALVASNIARSRYLDWYRNRTNYDPNDIEKLFKESMALEPKNPFSFCWYGTFLKEMRKDSIGAEKQYRSALIKANNHQYDNLHSHPLILNNIALLIMDEVMQRNKPKEALQEALALAEKAVVRVQETQSKFFWPEQTLADCEAMLNVETPIRILKPA